MNDKPNQPSPAAGNINDRVKTAVQAHRVKLRVLTTVAFAFGFLAMTIGLLMVWCYPFVVLPKQTELKLEAAALLRQYQMNSAGALPVEDVGKRTGELLAIEIEVNNVTTAGTAVVALAVGVLGLGMLVLLTVVVLNRRVALNQINTSLAQISQQLRELQTAREVSFHP